jgi:hypothetical protein
MPVVDDFARAQPLRAAPPSSADFLTEAREARIAALGAWLSAAWRLLLGRAQPRRLPADRP